MAKRRTKRTVKKPQSAVDNSNDSEEQKVEKQLPALSAHEVDRRVTAIEAICDAENEHLLTRLRLLRSYLSKDQATSQRLSVGMTPKTIRLTKHGEMLLSVHGSPLGVYREDNMEAIHESKEG